MKKLLSLAFASLALVACGQQDYAQPQQVPDQAPVVVQGQDSSTTHMLMGGALGYLLGRSNSPSSAPVQQHNTIIQQRTIIKEVQRPVPPREASCRTSA